MRDDAVSMQLTLCGCMQRLTDSHDWEWVFRCALHPRSEMPAPPVACDNARSGTVPDASAPANTAPEHPGPPHTMTVQQLIAELQALPPELPVFSTADYEWVAFAVVAEHHGRRCVELNSDWSTEEPEDDE